MPKSERENEGQRAIGKFYNLGKHYYVMLLLLVNNMHIHHKA